MVFLNAEVSCENCDFKAYQKIENRSRSEGNSIRNKRRQGGSGKKKEKTEGARDLSEEHLSEGNRKENFFLGNSS